MNAGGYRLSAVFDTQGLADVTSWKPYKLAAGCHILNCTRVFSFIFSPGTGLKTALANMA